MTMYHPFTFGNKKISSSVGMVETVIFDYMSHHYDQHLEDGQTKQTNLLARRWPMTMYHHTKFGYKRFSS